MAHQHQDRLCLIWMLAGGVLAEILLGSIWFPSRVLAQITPDETLGGERSQVTRDVEVRGARADRIDGGARRGANLFHSFREFNVNDGQRVYFANPSGVNNILGRVTGNDVSAIMGTLGVEGGANLFLINPNGIIFGANARLDVSGSFFASTGNRFTFSDGGEFSATNPQAPPLLSVSVPIGVQYGANRAGEINSQGNLSVNPGHSLILLGGAVNLDNGRLIAPGGHVEIGGVSEEGTVGLATQGNLFSLSFPNELARANVSLLNRSLLGVAAGDGGSVTINARNLDILGRSQILAGIFPGRGSASSQAGDVVLRATERTRVGQLSRVDNTVNLNSQGNSGDIRIRTGSLFVTDGSQLSTNTFGLGNAGNIQIQANNRVSFAGLGTFDEETNDAAGGAFSRVEIGAVGNGGDISITTGDLSLTNASLVDASTLGDGNAGNVQIQARDRIFLSNSAIGSQVDLTAVGHGGAINITTGALSMRSGGQIATNTFGQGDSGNIRIQARDRISLDGFVTLPDGTVSPSGIISSVSVPEAIGDGGKINISTRTLSITSGAQIQAETLGRGNGGDIHINARDQLRIDGGSRSGFNNTFSSSGIFSSVTTPEAVGNGDNVGISTGVLSITNGAQIGAQTVGQGNGGNIRIEARDRIRISGGSRGGSNGTFSPSRIFGDVVAGAVGNGGNIDIATGLLSITNGALVSSQSLGQGDGGSIRVNTDDSTILNGNGGIFAGLREGGIGDGGDIQISTDSLSIRNGARILTDSGGRGSAGNIRVNAHNHILLNGSITLANGMTSQSAVSTSLLSGAIGNGGNIQISADSLSISDGGIVRADAAGRGSAGNIHIDTRDRIALRGFAALANGMIGNSAVLTSLAPGAVGNGGNIQISTDSLSIRNGAQIGSGTLGQGDSGNIRVEASDHIRIDGGNRVGPSGLFSSSQGGAIGNGGDIQIFTGSLSVLNGAQVRASTLVQGDAGNIRINARDRISLNGVAQNGTPGGVFSTVRRGAVGNAGDININTALLSISNGAVLSTASLGQGRAGSINVSASSAQLDQGRIESVNTARRGGNITLHDLDLLSLRHGSVISATAGINQNGGGRGGNITINAGNGFVVADPTENSDITANAFTGNGGKIDITALGIFGLAPLTRQELQALLNSSDPSKLDPANLPSSDITAISQTSPTLSGSVTLTTPDTDPSRGLTELPTDVVDAANQINQVCPTRTTATRERGSFVVTGRGGLPPNPTDALNGDGLQTGWASFDSTASNSSDIPAVTESAPQAPLIEAQSWIKGANGEIILIAPASQLASQASPQFSTPSSTRCQ